ncbi:MAG: hypothetical protein ACI4SG_09005 [Oligosphaeraceae bacterium]
MSTPSPILLGTLALLLLGAALPAPLPAAQDPALFLFPEESPLPQSLNRRAGMEALSQRLYKNAIRYFTLALAEEKLPEEKDELSLLLARSLLLDGQHAEALKVANDTLTGQAGKGKDPVLADSLRLVAGLASLQGGDSATALNFLLPLRESPLMETSPARKAQILEALGQAWNASGLWEETRQALLPALSQFDYASPERISLGWRLLDATLPLGLWQETRTLLDELSSQPVSQERQALLKLLRIRCDIGEGKISEANQYYHASRLDSLLPRTPAPTWWEVLSSLAQACQAKGMPQEAAQLFGDAAQVAPSPRQARQARELQAEALVACQRLPEAKEILLALHEAQPQDSTLSLRLAEIRMSLQERRSASELFQQAAEDAALSRETRCRAWQKSAQCLSLEGLAGDASLAYQKAAALADTPRDQADSLLHAAREEERALHAQEAVRLYLLVADALADRLPSASEARLEAARLLRENAPAQAVAQLRKFLEERPDSPRLWEARLAIATATPEYARAVEEMLQVARECPQTPLAIQAYFEGHARALAQGGSGLEQAMSILQELLTRFPEMEGEKLRLARHQYLLLGLALEKPEALAWGRDFLTSYPDAPESPEVAMNLADWLSTQKRHAEAAQLYQTLQNFPQAPQALREMAAYEEAFCHAQLPDGTPKALELLRNLAATARQNTEVAARAAFLQGDLLTWSDAPQDALEQYRIAREKAGDTLLGLAATGRMAELLYALGKVEEAAREADAILRKEGHADRLLLARAKLVRARCYRRQGNLSMAKSCYHDIRLEYESTRGAVPDAAATPAVYVAAVNEVLEILDEQGEATAAKTVRQNYGRNPALPALPASPQPEKSR